MLRATNRPASSDTNDPAHAYSHFIIYSLGPLSIQHQQGVDAQHHRAETCCRCHCSHNMPHLKYKAPDGAEASTRASLRLVPHPLLALFGSLTYNSSAPSLLFDTRPVVTVARPTLTCASPGWLPVIFLPFPTFFADNSSVLCRRHVCPIVGLWLPSLRWLQGWRFRNSDHLDGRDIILISTCEQAARVLCCWRVLLIKDGFSATISQVK